MRGKMKQGVDKIYKSLESPTECEMKRFLRNLPDIVLMKERIIF